MGRMAIRIHSLLRIGAVFSLKTRFIKTATAGFQQRILRMAALLLVAALANALLALGALAAENQSKVVRVGWYESPFKYRCFALSKPSGSGNLARPKRTPRFFAASIPSACL